MQNKNIILGITGGIAAYKSAELTRLLRIQNAKVRIIMTQHAQEFITSLTMQTLSGNTVYTKMFDQSLEANLEHIELARWADAIVIAPTTANFIAKLTYGIADDLLSTVCLATTAPIAIVPAMNKEMWNSTITQKNIVTLKERGMLIFGPTCGKQACGEVGLGRMLEPQQILELIPSIFSTKIFSGKKIIITAGPTREPIDPIRYISNYSSGKMGYALAEAAQEAGANVILISGSTNLATPTKVNRINTQTAEDMYQAVMREISGCDIFIATAAVADYRPKNISPQKIKKNTTTVALELQPTPDILAEIASFKNGPIIIGFAAETENLLENARKKLIDKNLDIIIANQVGYNLCFDSDENSVVIFSKNNKLIELPRMQKTKLARQIMRIISSLQGFEKNNSPKHHTMESFRQALK